MFQFIMWIVVVWSVLKIFGAVDSPWLAVLSPLWVPALLWILLMVVVTVGKGVERKLYERKERNAAWKIFYDKLDYAIVQYGVDSKEVVVLIDAYPHFRDQADKVRNRRRVR